jgi:hypothetical protein
VNIDAVAQHRRTGVTMTEPDLPGHSSQRRFHLGVDWWATIVAGVFVVLAVAGVLPKIPW